MEDSGFIIGAVLEAHRNTGIFRERSSFANSIELNHELPQESPCFRTIAIAEYSFIEDAIFFIRDMSS